MQVMPRSCVASLGTGHTVPEVPNWLIYLWQAPIAGALFKREDEVVRVLMEAAAER